MKLEEVKQFQKMFKSNLSKIAIERYKSEEQRSALQNIKMLYNALIAPETKYKPKHRKRIKILTPKKILQKLLVALVQVKAGNLSGNLINKICQIEFSLVCEKQLLKKIYNNIMNSLQL